MATFSRDTQDEFMNYLFKERRETSSLILSVVRQPSCIFMCSVNSGFLRYYHGACMPWSKRSKDPTIRPDLDVAYELTCTAPYSIGIYVEGMGEYEDVLTIGNIILSVSNSAVKVQVDAYIGEAPITGPQYINILAKPNRVELYIGDALIVSVLRAAKNAEEIVIHKTNFTFFDELCVRQNSNLLVTSNDRVVRKTP